MHSVWLFFLRDYTQILASEIAYFKYLSQSLVLNKLKNCSNPISSFKAKQLLFPKIFAALKGKNTY